MDRTSAQAQVNPSLLRSNSLKFQPESRDTVNKEMYTKLSKKSTNTLLPKLHAREEEKCINNMYIVQQQTSWHKNEDFWELIKEEESKEKIQCCGSGMFIPDPKTATEERGEKDLLSYLFL